MRRQIHRFALFFLFALSVLGLSACGVMPNEGSDPQVIEIPGGPVPTPAPAASVEGFVSQGGYGYFINVLKEFCQFVNFYHWVSSGGPADVSGVTIANLPPDLKFKGACVPRGYFIVGSVIYHASGAGGYCGFETFRKYLSHGGPEDTAQLPVFASIPSTLRADGVCP